MPRFVHMERFSLFNLAFVQRLYFGKSKTYFFLNYTDEILNVTILFSCEQQKHSLLKMMLGLTYEPQ